MLDHVSDVILQPEVKEYSVFLRGSLKCNVSTEVPRLVFWDVTSYKLVHTFRRIFEVFSKMLAPTYTAPAREDRQSSESSSLFKKERLGRTNRPLSLT